MQSITLKRTQTGDQGTIGEINLPSGKKIYTIELPERGNQNYISCIPKGTYRCIVNLASKGGYRLQSRNGEDTQKVIGRSDVLIHIGNYAGDKSKGYYSDLNGCIAPGMTVIQNMVSPKVPKGQLAVSNSGDALKLMQKELTVPFMLIIE